MEGNDLKPCPFCGETIINIMTVSENNITRPYIFCDSCPAQMFDSTIIKKESIIKVWNIRTKRR